LSFIITVLSLSLLLLLFTHSAYFVRFALESRILVHVSLYLDRGRCDEDNVWHKLRRLDRLCSLENGDKTVLGNNVHGKNVHGKMVHGKNGHGKNVHITFA